MKFEDFEHLVDNFPIRVIEENIVCLKGKNTARYEAVLHRHGCTKSEIADIVKGRLRIGTYILVDEGYEGKPFDTSVLGPYEFSVECEDNSDYLKSGNDV